MGALFGEILGIMIAVIVGLPIAYYVGKCLLVTFLIASPSSSSSGQDDDTPRGGHAVYHDNRVQPEITLETTTVTHQITHVTPSHVTQYTANWHKRALRIKMTRRTQMFRTQNNAAAPLGYATGRKLAAHGRNRTLAAKAPPCCAAARLWCWSRVTGCGGMEEEEAGGLQFCIHVSHVPF
jgi:hypothetical protein